MKTKQLTTVAILCAMAVVTNLFISIPLIPGLFLRYDPADMVNVIAGFIYGPMTSFLMSVITSVLELMYRGGNLIDVLMNVISTCTFTCSAAFIYKKMHTKKGAFIGLACGLALNLIVMLLWNYIAYPLYYGMDQASVIPMLPPMTLFNFMKGSLNIALTLLLYKPIVQILRRTHLVESNANSSFTLSGVIYVVGFIILSIVAFICAFNGWI